MPSSSASRLGAGFGAFAGLALGAALVAALPLAEMNGAFLWALPLGVLVFLGVVLDTRVVVAIVLFSRVLLDPLLNQTRVEGLSLGFGAVLNLFVILVTAILVVRSGTGFMKNPIVKAWAVFIAVSAVAATFSPFPVKAVKLLFNLTSYVCMASLPFVMDPAVNDKPKWLKILLWTTVLPVLAANVDLVKGGSAFSDVSGGRILGTFTHPNILAFYLVLVVALVFFALRSGTFKLSVLTRLVLLGYLANLFVLLLATKTRNAWISCWLLFFLYGVIKERKFIFITLAAAVAAAALPAVAARALDLQQPGVERMNSFEWRLELWKSAVPWIKERPFFGHGLASFNDLSRQFFAVDRRGVDAHNTYVQILFEGGFAALFAYAAIHARVIGVFLSRVRGAVPRVSTEYAIALAYVITYVVSSFADNMFYYLALNWYFWFFVGIMLKATLFHGPRYLILRNHPVV